MSEAEDKEIKCYACAVHRNSDVQLLSENNNVNKCNELVDYKCNQWLSASSLPEDDQSVTESETSEFTDDGQSEFSDASYDHKVEDGQIVDVLENLMVDTRTFKNINITKSKNVHLGNVAKIYGPVQITQSITNVVQNPATNEIFLNGEAETVTAKSLNVVNRRRWLAQPPVGPIDRLQGPVKLVIISHTATESSATQAGNVELVRLIQTFHIESKEWYDIAYNFLVGCDGKTYEGRGWGAVGAHTFGYNRKGIGISFIGCFMHVLPNDAALYQAKAIIDYGVKIGEIDKDYVVVGHCQCCPTESPGRSLFKEIQTWDRWSNDFSQ